MKPTSRTSSWLWAASFGLAALATTVWRNRRGSYELAGRTVLITGGSRGLGLVLARHAAAEGARVAICARDEQELARARQDLLDCGATERDVLALSRDLTNADEVRSLVAEVESRLGGIDVLINNAGILGGMVQPALTSSIDMIKEVYNTNVFGVIEVTQAFIDLLRQSPAPRIVNVTSGLGSLTLHTDPSWKYYHVKGAAYQPSKAALNAYTIMLAYELRDTPFKVNAVDPGYTATDFNHHSGPGTVHDAAARVVKAAVLGPDGPTSQFFSDDNVPGTDISPW